ncbi:permease [Longibacter salinarum]|uniref:Probable membrane transporter protein n=1 Tax=Longibacter salinarum TaxID=1850348 RepID=A0A2A8D315_9BACT|nr:sulfite exporter TauE/SafE family protein [Longibacter salinarum]PEN15280.1 permease [Longibacter salinarum]
MYAAWFGALLVGLVLGLLGSGGSILTVPVLVYLVGVPDKLAIAESLGIVTLISLVGAIPFAYRKKVSWRNVGLFGVPGMVGAYGGAYLSKFIPGSVQLAIFALVMLLAAVMMFRRPGVGSRDDSSPRLYWKIMLDGLVVGVLTGLVGVGGGFLIVPALVLLGGLPMHLAIGTSLMIIALKSISGFVKYIDVMHEAGFSIHWDLVLIFGAIGIVGSFIGGKIGSYVPQARLKRGFAIFLVLIGVVILWQNAAKLFG